MHRINPGETRDFPFTLWADDAESVALALGGQGALDVIATSWPVSPVSIIWDNAQRSAGHIRIAIAAGEPPRKRHHYDLRITSPEGTVSIARVAVLVGWQ